MEKILQLYGRSFDQVKQFIDALAYMNSVNYNPSNDIPSQLLVNLAQTLGWTSNFSPITNEDFSYEYGTPSMTYFLLFSIFELRLLFFAWRARHHNLAFTNLDLYRRNLLKFYSFFCKCILHYKQVMF